VVVPPVEVAAEAEPQTPTLPPRGEGNGPA